MNVSSQILPPVKEPQFDQIVLGTHKGVVVVYYDDTPLESLYIPVTAKSVEELHQIVRLIREQDYFQGATISFRLTPPGHCAESST